MGSNHGPLACEANALPLSYAPISRRSGVRPLDGRSRLLKTFQRRGYEKRTQTCTHSAHFVRAIFAFAGTGAHQNQCNANCILQVIEFIEF
jgi:hypothetical protein